MNSTKKTLEKAMVLNKRLEQESTHLFQGYLDSQKNYYHEGEISNKYKQLMAVCAAVAVRCTPCMINHTNKALKAGATRQEVIESATVGVELGGGPSLVLVRNRLINILDDLENEG